jgi:hypothetical protein
MYFHVPHRHAVAKRPRSNASGSCDCGQLGTIFELFDVIVDNAEGIQDWTEKMKAFLAQERKEENLLVKL